ncbi:MAG: type II toxin-antitoxin system HicB family antitoxin [Chloroflexota bacterium]
MYSQRERQTLRKFLINFKSAVHTASSWERKSHLKGVSHPGGDEVMAQGYLALTATLAKDEETGEYVVRCPELGISTMAASPDDALPRICEAVTLFLNTLEEVGERERVFAERGIQMIEEEPPVETQVNARRGVFVAPFSVSVPIPVPVHAA